MSYQKPFIPHSSYVYRFAVSCGAIGRYIGTCIGMCLIVTVWIYGIYKPIGRLLEKKQADVCTQHLFVDRLVQTYKNMLNTEHEIQRMREQLPGWKERIPSSAGQLEHCVQVLFEGAMQTKIMVLSYIADPMQHKKKYEGYTARFVLESSLSHVTDFLMYLWQKKLPVKITRMTCAKGNNASVYVFTVDMSIFTYKKDPST